MSKKLIALLMAAMMVLSVAAACGKTDAPANDNTNTTPDNSSNTTTTTPSDTTTPTDTTEPEGKVYKTYLASEVASLNFIDNVDSNAATPAGYAMSQLWKMYPSETGTNYIWMDDLAVGDPIQVDDYNWQIKLREGATWQNGDPINADTWMFTFQQRLNPKMMPRMASFLYNNVVTIVNGENYLMQGTDGYPATVAWEEVGLKKVDDYTIQITTTDTGYTPTDITQQEKADSGYIRDRIHKVYISESDITVSWYQFSFESDGRQQISNLLEALEAADSSYRGEPFFGRHTVRWIITNGSDYRLMIVYDDTLLSITGTAQQAARIKDLAQALGYWE